MQKRIYKKVHLQKIVNSRSVIKCYRRSNWCGVLIFSTCTETFAKTNFAQKSANICDSQQRFKKNDNKLLRTAMSFQNLHTYSYINKLRYHRLVAITAKNGGNSHE